MSPRWPVLTVTLAGALAAGGQVPLASAGAVGAGPSSAFAEMLGTVPDDVLSAEGTMITYTDVGLIWQRVGITVHTEVFVIHATAADATANVDRINEHIASAVLTNGLTAAESFIDAEVVADGAIVRVSVPGDEAFSTMYALLYQHALMPM